MKTFKTDNFYELPQNVIDVLFNELSDEQGNEIKLMLLLLGVDGDGSFSLTEEWVKQKTGMSKQSYHSAKANLAERGFLILEDGKITVDIDSILKMKKGEHAGGI